MHAVAKFITSAQTKLRYCQPLLGSFAIPHGLFGLVTRHPLSFHVLNAKIVLGDRVTTFARSPKPLYRFSVILCFGAVDKPKSGLKCLKVGFIALFSSFLVPIYRTGHILLHETAFKVITAE